MLLGEGWVQVPVMPKKARLPDLLCPVWQRFVSNFANFDTEYQTRLSILRPQKMKCYITINYDLIPICFQTAELSGEAAPQKSMILQLNRVYNKDHHPFSAPCSTWSVKITSVVLKVKNFAIAAIICAIIRKRLAKVSRSCSG